LRRRDPVGNFGERPAKKGSLSYGKQAKIRLKIIITTLNAFAETTRGGNPAGVDVPFEAVLDADDLHPVLEHGLFRHGPDDGVGARQSPPPVRIAIHFVLTAPTYLWAIRPTAAEDRAKYS
jgi:hypothetical protein